MLIEKKTVPSLFNAVLKGKKTFDARLADFKCKPGDVIVLREWDPKTKTYTGRAIRRRVSYVLKTKDINFWPKKDVEKYGLQILGFKTEQER